MNLQPQECVRKFFRVAPEGFMPILGAERKEIMMKERTAGSVKVILLVIAAALFFSGFAEAGRTQPEKEAAKLMVYRAKTMQRAAFAGESDADVYSRLAETESHPLLREDMNALREIRSSDIDRIINAKVTGCEMKEKSAGTRFFEISVKWYLLGYDGYYSEEVTYLVRTVTSGRKMYLSDLQPA